MRGGAPERVLDTVEVIPRIGLGAGIPGHLLAENHLAIDHGGAFAIARAQIETDTAAVQMAAQRGGDFPFLRESVKRNAFESHGVAVDALAHEVEVEGAGALEGVEAAKISGDARIAGDGDPVSALLPEQEFQQALGVAMVQGYVGAFVGQRRGMKDGNRAVAARERERERLADALGHRGAVSPVPQRGWDEPGIESRTEFRGYANGSGHGRPEPRLYREVVGRGLDDGGSQITDPPAPEM